MKCIIVVRVLNFLMILLQPIKKVESRKKIISSSKRKSYPFYQIPLKREFDNFDIPFSGDVTLMIEFFFSTALGWETAFGGERNAPGNTALERQTLLGEH